MSYQGYRVVIYPAGFKFYTVYVVIAKKNGKEYRSLVFEEFEVVSTDGDEVVVKFPSGETEYTHTTCFLNDEYPISKIEAIASELKFTEKWIEDLEKRVSLYKSRPHDNALIQMNKKYLSMYRKDRKYLKRQLDKYISNSLKENNNG